MTVTECVGCGVSILGNRLRCPRCHEDHARELAAEDVAMPRPVHDRSRDPMQIALAWLVFAEVVTAFGLLAAFALGKC